MVDQVSIAAVRVHIATTFDELLALRSEWLALETASSVALPFQTWEWAVAWWRHFREDRISVRDRLRVCVVRDTSGRVLGIAPLVLTERPAVGPVRLRYLQFMGADPNITEIRSMLWLPGHERQCYEAVRECVATHAGEWDWIAWDGLGSQVGSAGTLSANLSSVEEKSAFVLELRPTWDSQKTDLRRNIKQSLRKCYNSLRRDGLASSLEIVDRPMAIADALNDFFRLHGERARLKSGPPHLDVFESPQARTFLTEACLRLAQRGVARVFRLRVGDQVVATRIGFEMGQALYLYYSGWDPAFGKYSVMTTLVAEVIQDAIDRGVHSVNLSTGKDVSKMRWGPDEVSYIRGVELSSRLAARARYFGYQAVSWPGARNLARLVMPGLLFRRSQTPPAGSRRTPSLPLMKLHAVTAVIGATVALDLLDSVLDGKVLSLSGLFAQFLG